MSITIYMFSTKTSRSGDFKFKGIKNTKVKSKDIREALVNIFKVVNEASTREDKVDSMLLELNKYKHPKAKYEAIIWILKMYSNKSNLKYLYIDGDTGMCYMNIKDCIKSIGFMKQLFNEV